jgi:hypothetical protein
VADQGRLSCGAFSGKVDTGFPQKMRPLRESHLEPRGVSPTNRLISVFPFLSFSFTRCRSSSTLVAEFDFGYAYAEVVNASGA